MSKKVVVLAVVVLNLLIVGYILLPDMDGGVPWSWRKSVPVKPKIYQQLLSKLWSKTKRGGGLMEDMEPGNAAWPQG